MPELAAPELAVVCPFCPLACDDLVAGESLSSGTENLQWPGCDHARHQFAAAMATPRCRIESEYLDCPDWDRFHHALGDLKTPVVEFHGATVSESKSLEDLISRRKLRLRAFCDASIAAVQKLVARDGVMAATLGEVCVRSDLIWCLGDVGALTPRLPDQLSESGVEMMVTSRLKLSDIAGLNQQFGVVQNGGEIEQSEMAPCMTTLLNRTNIAIVIGQSAFEAASETAVVEMLFRLIARWNDAGLAGNQVSPQGQSRMRLLAMTADQNLAAVNRWRNNSSLRMVTAADPTEVLRVGNSPGQSDSRVRVQIGGIDPGPSGADLYIPAAMPGVHMSDTTVRGDGSVALPLVGRITTTMSSRIEVLRKLIEA